MLPTLVAMLRIRVVCVCPPCFPHLSPCSYLSVSVCGREEAARQLRRVAPRALAVIGGHAEQWAVKWKPKYASIERFETMATRLRNMFVANGVPCISGAEEVKTFADTDWTDGWHLNDAAVPKLQRARLLVPCVRCRVVPWRATPASVAPGLCRASAALAAMFGKTFVPPGFCVAGAPRPLYLPVFRGEIDRLFASEPCP